MANGLTQEDLDRAQCMEPGCTTAHGPLFLHAACHPAAGTWAQYAAGELTLTCKQCKKHAAVIAVAQRRENEQIAVCLL